VLDVGAADDGDAEEVDVDDDLTTMGLRICRFRTL
jgi:hypothetical protein